MDITTILDTYVPIILETVIIIAIIVLFLELPKRMGGK